MHTVRLRAALLAGLLVCIALVLVTGFWLIALPRRSMLDSKELDKALQAAVREGDHATVKSLLDQRANVETRNEVGDTPLMQAVLNADTEMMQLLLQRGAKVNARGVYDVTVLLRAIHDSNKVKLLLDHGARVDARAMVLAAMVPGSRQTLELLLLHGGNVNAEVGGLYACNGLLLQRGS